LIVQIDELPQQPAGRVELHGEPAFGEIDLDVGGSLLEAAADIRFGLADEVGEELLLRIAVDAALGIEEAHRRGRDHGLLHGFLGVGLGGGEIGCGSGTVAERPSNEARQLPHMTVREGDLHAVRRQVVGTMNGIGREAGLGLLAVRDYRRSGRLEAMDRIDERPPVQLVQLLLGNPALLRLLDGLDQLGRTWNAADGFGGYLHECEYSVGAFTRRLARGEASSPPPRRSPRLPAGAGSG